LGRTFSLLWISKSAKKNDPGIPTMKAEDAKPQRHFGMGAISLGRWTVPVIFVTTKFLESCVGRSKWVI